MMKTLTIKSNRSDFWRSSGGAWGPRIFFQKKQNENFAETDTLLDNIFGVKPSKRMRRFHCDFVF